MSALAAISFPVSLWIAVSQRIFRFFFLEISNKPNSGCSIYFVPKISNPFDARVSNWWKEFKLLFKLPHCPTWVFVKEIMTHGICTCNYGNLASKRYLKNIAKSIILGCFCLKSDPETTPSIKTSTRWYVGNVTINFHFSFVPCWQPSFSSM